LRHRLLKTKGGLLTDILRRSSSRPFEGQSVVYIAPVILHKKYKEQTKKGPFTDFAPCCLSCSRTVDARQRNERNARMGTLETGWLRVVALSGSAEFAGRLDMSTLRLRGGRFVYKKSVPNKPQNKKQLI
jgi:hypothetical protein